MIEIGAQIGRLRIGHKAPSESIASAVRPAASMSELEECDPTIWLTDRDAARTELLLEQLLGQAHEYAMVLLHAELTDPDDDGR